MTTKHTPGPWSFGKWDDRTNGRHIDAETCPHIASALYMGGTATADANARLIVAAPDLLAACEAAEFLQRDGGTLPIKGEVWKQLVAAIKKAKCCE